MTSAGRPSPSFVSSGVQSDRFAIVVSRYNSEITDDLLDGAVAQLLDNGVSEELMAVYTVPGAWELPQAAQMIASTGSAEAIIALGCVIRGETSHFDYICLEASLGLGSVARKSGLPIAFGVLTTDSLEQARARSGRGNGNKGREAAQAVLEMLVLRRKLEKNVGLLNG